jgi:hypothetical protein
MDGQLLTLIDTIVRDKGIEREVLIQAIETAYRKVVAGA